MKKTKILLHPLIIVFLLLLSCNTTYDISDFEEEKISTYKVPWGSAGYESNPDYSMIELLKDSYEPFLLKSLMIIEMDGKKEVDMIILLLRMVF